MVDMALTLPYASIFVCVVAGFLLVLRFTVGLCYVLFVDAFNLRKRRLARFARCGRFAMLRGLCGPFGPTEESLDMVCALDRETKLTHPYFFAGTQCSL